MAARSEPWRGEEEARVVRRVPIAMSIALEVLAELRMNRLRGAPPHDASQDELATELEPRGPGERPAR